MVVRPVVLRCRNIPSRTSVCGSPVSWPDFRSTSPRRGALRFVGLDPALPSGKPAGDYGQPYRKNAPSPLTCPSGHPNQPRPKPPLRRSVRFPMTAEASIIPLTCSPLRFPWGRRHISAPMRSVRAGVTMALPPGCHRRRVARWTGRTSGEVLPVSAERARPV